MTAFERALRECVRWGVKVLLLKQDSPEVQAATREDRQAPIHRACINDKGHVLWWDSRSAYDAAGLLHEMAHVIVWRELGQEPDSVFELESMLAIEAEANRRIRSNWKSWMGYYMLDSGVEWSQSSTQYRHQVLCKALENAQAFGLMRKGKPTYKRTRKKVG